MALNLRALENAKTLRCPIWGNAADVPTGAFVGKSTTPGTHNGSLIPMTGDGTVDEVGRLLEALDYSEDGETLVAGTSFVQKRVSLISNLKLHLIEYSQASADLITCTQAVTTTTMTVTSLEDNIDAAFVYVAEGTGIGQTNYFTASAAGAGTLKAAFGTSLDTTSKFVKILPRFHTLTEFNSDGTKLSSGANAPTGRGVIFGTFIQRRGVSEDMSPVKHAALTGLNNIKDLKFWALVAFANALPYTID